jgi:hypothetical protein
VFGVWALFRVIMRYCGAAGLGLLRGLEREASASPRGWTRTPCAQTARPQH